MINFFKKLFSIDNVKNKNKIEKIAFDVQTIPENYDLKFEFNNIHIAGVQYAKPDKTKLSKGEKLDLIFERKNRYDSNAIKIMQNGIKLGYIPKRNIIQGLIHLFYKNNDIVLVTLKRINPKSISMDLKFYGDINRKYECINTRLIKIDSKAYRENWDFIEEGDLLDVEFDIFSERFIVVNNFNDPIGEISKKISSTLDSNNDILCHIDDIDYDYDDDDDYYDDDDDDDDYYDDKKIDSVEVSLIYAKNS